MKKSLLSLIALGVLGGLFVAGNSWGQDEPAIRKQSQRSATGAGATAAPNAAGTSRVIFTDDLQSYFGRDLIPQRPLIEHLMIELREAADDAKKADLKKQLELAVTENFEEDMTSRETDLTKLEARLTKLRAQLDRRRKAQAEIIQLHLKVMVNEADGLGFSGTSVFKDGWLSRSAGTDSDLERGNSPLNSGNKLRPATTIRGNNEDPQGK